MSQHVNLSSYRKDNIIETFLKTAYTGLRWGGHFSTRARDQQILPTSTIEQLHVIAGGYLITFMPCCLICSGHQLGSRSVSCLDAQRDLSAMFVFVLLEANSRKLSMRWRRGGWYQVCLRPRVCCLPSPTRHPQGSLWIQVVTANQWPPETHQGHGVKEIT